MRNIACLLMCLLATASCDGRLVQPPDDSPDGAPYGLPGARSVGPGYDQSLGDDSGAGDAAQGGPQGIPSAFDPSTRVHMGTSCSPYGHGPAGPFVPAGTADPASQSVSETASAIEGSWIGHANAPSSWLPSSWYVWIDFRADGHYAAEGFVTTTPLSDPPAFYYGTNDNTDSSCAAMKKWQVTGINSTGALGTLGVPFWYGTVCGLPTWQGELTAIELDASRNRVQFAFGTDDGYGPVQYDLLRVCGM